MAANDTARGPALHDAPAVIWAGLNWPAPRPAEENMTQTQSPGQQIGEHELDELETLADDWVDHGGMPLEALDGFFSALVVGPDPAPAVEEFLPVAVGEDLQWDSREDAEHAIGLLMKLWNHVVWRVAQELPDEDDESEQANELGLALMPIVGLPAAGDDDGGVDDDDDPLGDVPPDFPLGALWASGFLQGVALREQGWEQWMQDDEDLLADLRDISLLGLVDPDQAGELGMDWEERYDLDERWQLMASVPALLQDLYLSRLEERATTGTIRRDPGPGRNDPCTCGSGRKWKKCCGAPTLH